MKTKPNASWIILLLGIFSVSYIQNTFAQNEYFESGAVWHHEYTLFYVPHGYSKTFVNGLVTVGGVQAVKLSGEYATKEPTSPTTYFYSGIVPLPDMYMRSSNDSVFIFREGAFHLAYKTNAVVGEVWDLGPNANYTNLQDNHSYLRVDSVYYKNVNGLSLRHINTTACYSNGSDFPPFGTSFMPFLYPLYQGVFNEKYGPSLNFRSMIYVGLRDTSTIIDYYQNGFLCYQSDSTVQLSLYPNVDCFQGVYLEVEEKEADLFTVSPNPSDGVFKVNNLSNTDFELIVQDPLGRIVSAQKSSSNLEIDLSVYPPGTFFAIIQKESSTQVLRLMKK